MPTLPEVLASTDFVRCQRSASCRISRTFFLFRRLFSVSLVPGCHRLSPNKHTSRLCQIEKRVSTYVSAAYFGVPVGHSQHPPGPPAPAPATEQKSTKQLQASRHSDPARRSPARRARELVLLPQGSAVGGRGCQQGAVGGLRSGARRRSSACQAGLGAQKRRARTAAWPSPADSVAHTW